MMSLNRADELRRELEEKHDFNAEQANGTMIVVDEIVDHGFDRVLKSIADLDSKIDWTATSLRIELDKEKVSLRTELGKDIESLRTELGKDIESLRTDVGKDIESLRTDVGKDFESLRSDMDKRFNSVDRHFTLIQVLLPFASAFTTIILLAALAAIFGDAQSSVRWLIPT